MMDKWLKILSLISLIFMNGGASSAELSKPEALVHELSHTVTQRLQAVPVKERSNEKAAALIREVVLPHFNVEEMARRIVGAPWKTATESLKAQFKTEFTRMMINSYAAAFKSYRGETVRVLPLREAVKSPLQIASEIILKNGAHVKIYYALKLHGTRWYVYDFSVNGVSIVNNYREQFNGTLRQQGLSGLVKQMQLRAAARK